MEGLSALFFNTGALLLFVSAPFGLPDQLDQLRRKCPVAVTTGVEFCHHEAHGFVAFKKNAESFSYLQKAEPWIVGNVHGWNRADAGASIGLAVILPAEEGDRVYRFV